MPEGGVFLDLTVVLAAAVAGGGLAQVLRQPTFVGYILAGLAVTAVAGPSAAETGAFRLLAEFGVVLLMFALGLEFSLRDLWRVRGLAFLGAPAGMAATAAVVVAAAGALAAPPSGGIVAGLALAVCSTMALAKLLADRGDLNGPVGRASIGIALAQDLLVVAIILFLPALATPGAAPVGVGGAFLRAAAVLVPFFLLAHRLVPALLARVAHAQNTELFVLVAVAIGVGTAALSAWLGLSLALGAFLAGLVISESDYTVETLARVLPLRDLFVALFFVSIGMLIDPRAVLAQPGLLGAMIAVVLVGKVVIWGGVALAFRLPLAAALAVGLGQSQIGEFSFVIAQLGRRLGVLSEPLYGAILATSLITLLVNALVFRRSRPLERWADRWGTQAPAPADGTPPAVMIVGYGRVGGAIGEALETFRVPFAVIDFNPMVVHALRQRRIAATLGDAANAMALRRGGAGQARLVVIAIPDDVKAAHALALVRATNPSVAVVARAHSREAREQLLAAGAADVILPEEEAGLTLVDHTLHRLAIPSPDVRAYLRRLREVQRPGGRIGEGVPGTTLPQTAVVVIADGPLAHQSLRRARIRERTGVTVVGIVRGSEEPHWNPPPDAVLLPGDRVTVVGLLDQIERFRRFNAGDEG